MIASVPTSVFDSANLGERFEIKNADRPMFCIGRENVLELARDHGARGELRIARIDILHDLSRIDIDHDDVCQVGDVEASPHWINRQVVPSTFGADRDFSKQLVARGFSWLPSVRTS
jgi:hypothetical protein